MRYTFVLLSFMMLLCGCQSGKEQNLDLVHRIPTDTKIVLHTRNLEDVKQLITSNEIYKQLQNTSRFKEIEKASHFLSDYDIKEESLVALSMEGRNEVVITLITQALEQAVDSTSQFKNINYNGEVITAKSKGDQTVYALNHKGLHIASSSQLVIESLINRNVEDYVFDASFEHIYERTKNGGLAIYIKASEKNWLQQFLLGQNISDTGNHAQWYQLEPQSSDVALQLDGIITYQDSMRMDHDLYNNLRSKENRIQEVTPVDMLQLRSVTYDNPTSLTDNLSRFHSQKISLRPAIQRIIENTTEMSEVYLNKGRALIFTLKPDESLFLDFDSLSSGKFTYRDQVVYELKNPLSTASLSPLVQSEQYAFVTVLDQHMIFAKSPSLVELYISNYQNKTVLAEQSWWKDAGSAISGSSSLLKITALQYYKSLAEEASSSDQKIIEAIDEELYPIMISQYVHEDEYAHYHLVIPATNGASVEQQISQTGVFKSEASIIAGPFLFPNHVTKAHDVAFQDENFVLHLLSDTGKKWWSKPLDGPILGEIEVTDAYKNGRKQLAFATSNAVYFLDRNGKDVNAYPKKFSQKITQPLSVFDYDKRREYRFLVTQGKELMMYDREGNRVSGFQYRPDAEITTQPKHFRVGYKDYIAFAKANGKLALLHRTGSERTKVKDEIYPKTELYFHQNKILTLTKDAALASINLGTGKLSLKEQWQTDEELVALPKVSVRQDNNVLRINGEKVTLPYGTYLPAQITKLGKQHFVHLVERGENKVYILDVEGNILPSLPVYGTGTSRIAQSKGRYLVTLDDRDVIIYKW